MGHERRSGGKWMKRSPRLSERKGKRAASRCREDRTGNVCLRRAGGRRSRSLERRVLPAGHAGTTHHGARGFHLCTQTAGSPPAPSGPSPAVSGLCMGRKVISMGQTETKEE